MSSAILPREGCKGHPRSATNPFVDLAPETRPGVTLITLPRIPLDTAFVSEFTADVGTLLAAQPRLVIDMRRLLFVDSSGVGALVNALSRSRKLGGDIKLANVPAQVRSVLAVVHLDKLFATFPSVDEAVAAFANA